METVNNEQFYSCSEIAKGINNNSENFTEIGDLFRTVYNKKSNFFFTDTYIQSKLYTASDKGRIRYISFKKNDKNITYRSYTIPDVIAFLKTPNANHIAKCETLNNIKIYEVGEM